MDGVQHCEDSNLRGSQHSPEPADGIKLQELRRASTIRPVRHGIFSQAKPTSTRPDLDNFLGLPSQAPRPRLEYRAWAHVSLGRHPATNRLPTIFSFFASLFEWFEFIPNQSNTPSSRSLKMRGPQDPQSHKIRWAAQPTNLLRCGLLNPGSKVRINPVQFIFLIYPSTSIIQHSFASQDLFKFQDTESCSAYLLTRFASFD